MRYEGTGYTSHRVIEEYFAISEDDGFDYALYIELSSGEEYGTTLIGDLCYAFKSEG